MRLRLRDFDVSDELQTASIRRALRLMSVPAEAPFGFVTVAFELQPEATCIPLAEVNDD